MANPDRKPTGCAPPGHIHIEDEEKGRNPPLVSSAMPKRGIGEATAALYADRSNAMKATLVEQGVYAARIETPSGGESLPGKPRHAPPGAPRIAVPKSPFLRGESNLKLVKEKMSCHAL